MSYTFPHAASPYLVPFDSSFCIDKTSTSADRSGAAEPLSKKAEKHRLKQSIREIRELQARLYADDQQSLLLIFQAMDAAGKDGTIRAVLSGVNPAGCQVFSFKRPSAEERDHDFLWRIARALPERGRIGVFNRSHYEEVLVVKVQPELVPAVERRQVEDPEEIWTRRYESIRSFEKHLANSGTVILKFFLNVGRDEQRNRLLKRIDEKESNWKFEAGDLDSRSKWPSYMKAYEQALNESSRPWAPWYCIPADSKPYMRATVADIVKRTLQGMALQYPVLSAEDEAEMHALKGQLTAS